MLDKKPTSLKPKTHNHKPTGSHKTRDRLATAPNMHTVMTEKQFLDLLGFELGAIALTSHETDHIFGNVLSPEECWAISHISSVFQWRCLLGFGGYVLSVFQLESHLM